MAFWRSVAITLLALPVQAEPFDCDGIQITSKPGLHGPICRDARAAIADLATCGLSVPMPLDIAVVEDLGENCLGIYRCGEGRIEILPPGRYAAWQADGAFADVSLEAFVSSVVRHELVHAALEGMPCPFDSCIVGQEYLAYGLQVMFLPPDDRAAFEASMPYEREISRDELSAIILAMAPDIFARKAWAHLKARPDPCAFAGQISRAEVLLDYEGHF